MNARLQLLRYILSGAMLHALAVPVYAQDDTNPPPETADASATSDADQSSGTNSTPPKNGQLPGKPYTARVQVDTRTPVTYGDDVVISIWIAPTDGFNLKEVRLHPKGSLSALYQTIEKNTSGQSAPGTECRTSVQNARAGIPFVATCRLTGMSSGLERVFNWNAVLLTGDRQQFEVEVEIREGVRGAATYYEFGAVDFVSPMLSVILGGLLGAGLWTLFLPISVPLPAMPSKQVDSWRTLWTGALDATPQLILRWIAFGSSFVRSTLLGGATALVLIVLAKTTEGLDTPIALQVQDLWGGLLVGIFSAPMSKWIRKKVEKMI